MVVGAGKGKKKWKGKVKGKGKGKGTGKLEIYIPNDRVTHWMVTSNLIHGRPANTYRWDGVLFCLIDQLKVFPYGTSKKQGLSGVELLQGPATVRTVTASEFNDGHFLYVVTNSGAPILPSQDPVGDAKRFWDPDFEPPGPRELSKNASALKGGIILWRFLEDPVTFKMGDKDFPYKFACVTTELEILHYDATGNKVNFPAGTVIDKIILHEKAPPPGKVGPPGDLMNPPRYP